MRNDPEEEVSRLQTENEIQRQQIQTMEKMILDLKTSEEALKRANEQQNMENERLRSEVAGYQEERKEAQNRIQELEAKVKRMEIASLDVTRFGEWNWNEIHLWIMTLDEGRFRKYDAVLRNALSATDTTGQHL